MKFLPKNILIFSPVGSAVLIIALIMLIRSLLARNSYEILLSSAALILLLVLGIIGMWKTRKLKSLEPGWKPPFPMTANAGENTLITGLNVQVPLFFRLHFIVRGSFYPASSLDKKSVRCRVLVETSVPRGETQAHLPLDFPLSGIFQGEGYCCLKDIFGFFSFSCGVTLHRTLKVRSAPCFGKDYHIKAYSGAEDKRNKQSSDEERYYMREYTPGDRLRDINWKSSEKIDALITRISPDNQEKVNRIEVYFRNYGTVDKPSLEALWLLDRAKARLSHFLRSLIEQQSSFIFDVRCAGSGNWEINDQESLEVFLDDLAGVSFSPPQNEGITPVNPPNSAGELYIFSTACDKELPGFILACNPRPVSLFFVQPLGRDKGQVVRDSSSLPNRKTTRLDFIHQSSVPDVLYKRSFPAKGSFPPLRFLRRDKINQLNAASSVSAQAGKVEIIYAGTKV